MRRTILTVATAVALLTAWVSASPAAVAVDDVIVTFHDDVGKAQLETWAKVNGCAVLYRLHTSNSLWVELPAGKTVTRSQLAADPLVAAVAAPDDAVGVPGIVPDDPWYADQWHLDNPTYTDLDVQAEDAWDEGVSASDVTIAIIDSGVLLDHPDLQDNIVPGWDPANGDSDPSPVFGEMTYFHGTTVAGVAAAVGDNGIGATGMSWDVKIMPFMIHEEGDTLHHYDYLATIAAVDSAVAAGVDIINCSFHYIWPGGGGSWGPPAPVFAQAFEAASDAGIVVTASAGNDDWDLDDLYHQRYPANFTFANVVTVSSSSRKDQYVGGAYGDQTVDIAAPGWFLPTTDVDENGNAIYALRSGTSYAAPLAAGAIALAKAGNPGLSYPDQILDLVFDRAETPPGLAGLVIGGRRLNAYRPLVAEDLVDPGAITDLAIVDSTSTSITLRWTEPGEDGASGRLDHFALAIGQDQAPGERYPVLDLPIPHGPGHVHTYTVEGLNRGTQAVHVRLAAVDDYRRRVTAEAQCTLPKPDVEVDPQNHTFIMETGESLTGESTFRNLGNWEAVLVPYLFSGGGEWFSFSTDTLVIAPQDSAVYSFTCDASGLCSGLYQARLGFDGEGYPNSLDVNMYVLDAPEPAVEPVGVSLGTIPVGSTHVANVELTNIGCDDLAWNAAMSPPGTWSVRPGSGVLSPAASRNLRVTITATAPGPVDLVITTNAPFDSTVTVPIAWRLEEIPHQEKTGPDAQITPTWECYPNPFNPETTIRFSLADAGATELQIFDVRGFLVRRDELGVRGPGIESVRWQGRDDAGRAVPSGTYFCRLLQSGRQLHDTMKLKLVK